MNIRFTLNSKFMSAAVLAGGLFFACANAYGYSYRTCNGNNIKWNNGWTKLYISTTSFPVGSSWDSNLQNAMWYWNNVKGSRFNFDVKRDTDGKHSSGNGVNEVYAASLSSGALTVTSTRYHCYWFFGYQYGLDETDTAFNTNYSWSTGAYSYSNPGGSPYNFGGAALHALGHSLGLLDENRWLATMNTYYPHSGPLGHFKEWDPWGDDRRGARWLYSDGTTEVDVAGSPLKRTGSGSSGLLSSPASAARGSWVTIEFTFTNQSTSTQSFDIGFYLSTNTFITTEDQWLGTNTGAWGSAGFAGTFTRSLWIPTSVAPGTYSLGFLIDPNNVKGENNEGNNSQQLPRKILIL